MEVNKLLEVLNEICDENNLELIKFKDIEDFKSLNLKNDIGFDSINLAQLTVLIEDECDVDIFEDGLIETVGEVFEKIK